MAKEEKYICRKPGSRSVDIIRRDGKVIGQSLTREYSFVWEKAKGCYVWDADGKRYLDFSAGVAVANIGYTDNNVVNAICEQAKKGVHCGFSDFYAELPVKFAEKLLAVLPPHLNNVFFSNSGAEAVESAIKLAKWHTNRKWLVAFKPCFHGRTMGALSLTNSKPIHRARYGPFLPVKHADYPYFYRSNFKDEAEYSKHCLDVLEKTIKPVKGDVAGIFLEPIAGEPGYIVPPKYFVKGLREICDKHGILLCDDEIQAGCYRTGKFLAIENFDAKPDVVCLSKAIGAGIPMGVTVANKSIMDWLPGSHANTLGGNLLACAAGVASLDFMKKNNIGDNARNMGNYMMKRLNEMKEKYEIIGDVRGIGLMIGIELVKDKKNKKPAFAEKEAILCRASESGLILLSAGFGENAVIRMCPPLIINKEQADSGLDIFEDAVRRASKK